MKFKYCRLEPLDIFIYNCSLFCISLHISCFLFWRRSLLSVVLCFVGDHCYQLFMVQGSLSQQSLLLSDAAHRRAMHSGSSPEHHCASILDHQASKKSRLQVSLISRSFYGTLCSMERNIKMRFFFLILNQRNNLQIINK